MLTKKKYHYLRYLAFSLAVILFGSILGYHQLTPTRVPKDYKEKLITLSEVSTDKADYSMVLSHVYHMSKGIHPSGSIDIKNVQHYLTEQFDAIDCEYQTQNFEVDMAPFIEEELRDYELYMDEHPVEREPFDEYLKSIGFESYESKLRYDYNCTNNTLLPMTNYLVKLDAPESEEGVLFVSHYDSTKGGPGASDDLISVSAMLETLREAAGNEARKNDLYFLFTDGEEMELFGSEHYVNTNSSSKDNIKMVINLEARGTSGPLIMFETSLQNKNIIKMLNKALDHNLMFSFAVAVYRLMPNNTDLSSFLSEGYPGINFAMIGNPENYHAKTDTFQNLNRDSAYMYYKTTSTLANYLSTSDLDDLSSSEDAVYFPFLKGNTIVLSNRLMIALSFIVGALSLVWIGFLLFKRVISLKQFIITLLQLLLALLPAVIIGFLCSFLYNRLLAGRALLEIVTILNTLYYAFCILSIIATLSTLWIIMRRKDTQTTLAGVLLVFTTITTACTILLNGLAYLFLVPLMLLLLYSIHLFYKRNKAVILIPRYLYTALFGIILCLLYIPAIDLLYTALLNSGIIAIFLIAGIGVLPFAILCIYITYHKKENEVTE
jgi:hypothetical protein